MNWTQLGEFAKQNICSTANVFLMMTYISRNMNYVYKIILKLLCIPLLEEESSNMLCMEERIVWCRYLSTSECGSHIPGKFERWCCRRMQKISWADRMGNEVCHKVNEEMYRVIKKSPCIWWLQYTSSCLTTWLNLTTWQPTTRARGTLDSH
jgi:hypothetical protein